MPLYKVEHLYPLSEGQRDELAAVITHIHSTLFTTPSLFVNVRFVDAGSQSTYVGGKRRLSNRITGFLRHGPSRTQEDYNTLCSRIAEAWKKVVNSSGEEGAKLRAIFIVGGLIAGWEAGFAIPPAGEDGAWLASNAKKFQEIAANGDEDFKDLVKEMQEREEFANVLEKAKL